VRLPCGVGVRQEVRDQVPSVGVESGARHARPGCGAFPGRLARLDADHGRDVRRALALGLPAAVRHALGQGGGDFMALCVVDGLEKGRRPLYYGKVELGVALTPAAQTALDVLGVSLSTLLRRLDTAREKALEDKLLNIDKFKIDEDVIYTAARNDESFFFCFLRCLVGLGRKKPVEVAPGKKLNAEEKRSLLLPWLLKQLVSAVHYPCTCRSL